MKTIRIGEKVQNFYNAIPFPNYNINKFEDKESLKLYTFAFAKVIDRSIPENASVIDVGCGTGQLSAFLSLRRKVTGVDFSDSSLDELRELKKKLKLSNLEIREIDILDLKQIKKLGKFDYVLCLGVLHHTGDAYQGFQNILHLLKPNGKIAIGLYNKIGRLPLKVRKVLLKTIFRNSQKVKEHFMRMQMEDLDDKKKFRGWLNDQYFHVHETTHTIWEVLKWFKRNNIKFIQSVPSSTPFNKTDYEIAGVWNNYKEIYPYFPFRVYVQLTWLWKTQREGGYWITFGKLK